LIFNTKEKTVVDDDRRRGPGGTSAPTSIRSLYLKRYRRSYKTTSGVIVGTIIVVIEKEEPSRSGSYSRIFKVQGQDSVEVEKEVRLEKEVRHNPLSSFEEILLETIKGQGFCEETILTKHKYQ